MSILKHKHNGTFCTIISKEGTYIQIPILLCMESNLIKNILDIELIDNKIRLKDIIENKIDENLEIPLPNINYKTLIKIIQILEYSLGIQNVDEEYIFMSNENPIPILEKPLATNNFSELVDESLCNFLDIPNDELFELINSLNYMDIKSLLELVCAKIACMIKGKSPEEIRKTFNIENDFTPEQEKQIQTENNWCTN